MNKLIVVGFLLVFLAGFALASYLEPQPNFKAIFAKGMASQQLSFANGCSVNSCGACTSFGACIAASGRSNTNACYWVDELGDFTTSDEGTCQKFTCSDSDNSATPPTTSDASLLAKGTVTTVPPLPIPEENFPLVDRCVDGVEQNVYEFFCEDSKNLNLGIVNVKNVACPSGYSCSEGKCISTAPQIGCTSTSKIGDVTGDGKITNGDASIVLQILLGKKQLTGDKCCADTDNSGSLTVTDALTVSRMALGFTVGGTCDNRTVCVNDNDCTQFGTDYGCVTGGLCAKGARRRPTVTPPRVVCRDSDNGSSGAALFVRGTTTYGNSRSTDFCNGSRAFFEFYCNSEGRLARALRYCPKGYSCKVGACVKSA